MVGVLEGEAEDEDGNGHGGGGEADDDEAGFGLDVAGVAAEVVVADGVVEPVAKNGTKGSANYGGKVEEAWVGWG